MLTIEDKEKLLSTITMAFGEAIGVMLLLVAVAGYFIIKMEVLKKVANGDIRFPLFRR